MISEVVVTDPSGNERPDVNVDDAEPSVPAEATATVSGAYRDPDGDPVSLSASQGRVIDDGGGRFTWTDPSPAPGSGQLVYITATDSQGLKGQIPFYLQVGPGGPGSGPATKGPAANEAPVLKGLGLTPKAFVAAKGITKPQQQATASRKRHGAKIGFNLSEPATVRFTVNRIRPRSPKLKAPAFSRQVTKAGNAAIRFTARFRKERALPPGRYRLTAEATDSEGLRSKPLRTTFAIVR